MPKYPPARPLRMLMLVAGLLLATGCAAEMDPDYAQPRPMSYSWSSGDYYGHAPATGDELFAIIYAAVYAPFIIADMLHEWLD